nr:F-box domain-containing protein [Tanacetum cinerariifolium]
MSHLPQIALASNSNQFKEMLSVYFDKENDKDFKQINEMQNMAQELYNRVKERGELINMLLAFNLSQDAFESLKLLKELQEDEMAKTRSLMKGITETQLRVLKKISFVGHLLEVLYVYCLASQLMIHAAVTDFLILRTFLFYDKGYDTGQSLHFGRPEFSLIIALRFGTVSFRLWRKGEVKFVSRVLPKKVGDKVTNLYILDVIEDEELMGNLCEKDAVRVCLLLLLEVIFMDRYGFMESCEESILWWDKQPNVIPRGVAWSRKNMFTRSDYTFCFGKESKLKSDMTATISEVQSNWYKCFREFFMVYVPRSAPRRYDDLYEDYIKNCLLLENVQRQKPRIYQLFLGCQINAVYGEKLDFSESFGSLSEELYVELNKEFNELTVAPLFGIRGSRPDQDYDDDVIKEYLIQEETRLRVEQEEIWRLQEQKMMEEVFVNKLKEEVKLRVENKKLVKPDEADWAMVGAYFVQLILQDSIPVWYASGTRHLDPTLVKISFPYEGHGKWLVSVYTLSINSWYPVENHRLPRESIRIKNRSGQAVLGSFIYWVGAEKFTASDGSYTKTYVLVSFNLCTHQFQVSDIPEELRDVLSSPFHISQLAYPPVTLSPIVEVDDLGYQLAHKLQVYDPISEEFLNAEVFQKKGIDPTTYNITFRNVVDVPKQGWTALAYREQMAKFFLNIVYPI